MATMQQTAPATEKLMTPDEFMQLKIERAELIDGKVIEIMPTLLSHDRLVTIISGLLDNFVTLHQLGMVVSGGSFRTGPNQVRVPDVCFISTEDLEGEDPNSYIRKAPTLAVEIISKNDTYGEVADKADEFMAAGSRMVWVVNPRWRTVNVHAPDESVVTYQMGDFIAGAEVLPDLQLAVADIFKDARIN